MRLRRADGSLVTLILDAGLALMDGLSFTPYGVTHHARFGSESDALCD